MLFAIPILSRLNGNREEPERTKPVHLIVDSDLLFEKSGQTDIYKILDGMGCDINPERRNSLQTHIQHDEKILEPEIENVMAIAATKRQLEGNIRTKASLLANKQTRFKINGRVRVRGLAQRDKQALAQSALEQEIHGTEHDLEELIEKLKREKEKIERLKQAYIEAEKYQDKKAPVSIDDIIGFLEATSMLRVKHIGAGGKEFLTSSFEDANEEEQTMHGLSMRSEEIGREIVRAIVKHNIANSKMVEGERKEVEAEIIEMARRSSYPLDDTARMLKSRLGIGRKDKMDIPEVARLFEQLRVINRTMNIKGGMGETKTLRTDFHDRILVIGPDSYAEHARQAREAARIAREKEEIERFKKNRHEGHGENPAKPEDTAA